MKANLESRRADELRGAYDQRHRGTARGHRERLHSGFTLIELLVVIAIIGILASILFPVFGRARENARRSSCMSNLKQMGLGVMQYIQDYDSRYPPKQGVLAGQNPVTYVETIQPFVKNYQLFKCPSGLTNAKTAEDASTKQDGMWRVLASAGWRGNPQSMEGHYGMNSNLTDLSGGGISESAINKTAETALAFDCAWYESSGYVLAGDSMDDARRHFDGTVVSYADGHAKFQNNLLLVNFMP